MVPQDGGEAFAAVLGDGHVVAAIDQLLGDQSRGLAVVFNAENLFSGLAP